MLLWTGGVGQDLGNIPGSNVRPSISDVGLILASESHIYRNGEFASLIDLLPDGHGLSSLRAAKMNAGGQVLARAKRGEIDHVVVLSPVPEPTTLVGLGTGLLLLLSFRNRFRA